VGSPAGTPSMHLESTRRAAVMTGGREVKLTNLEFRLLRLLMSRPGHVFPTNEIIQSVWGSQGESDASLLKNVIYRLRRKLGSDEGDMGSIQTWPGGYTFHEE
jgi:DNA-binding response OmpR family regulator